MKEKPISASGIFTRKLLAPIGPVLVWLFHKMGVMNDFFFGLFMILVCLVMLVYLKSVKVKFTEHYVKFGNAKIDYSEIIDLKTISINDYTYWLFKTKNKSIWKRYYVTELSFFGLIEIIKLILGKKDKLKIQEFEELLFQKSSIPKRRWKEIMGSKEFKKATNKT